MNSGMLLPRFAELTELVMRSMHHCVEQNEHRHPSKPETKLLPTVLAELEANKALRDLILEAAVLSEIDEMISNGTKGTGPPSSPPSPQYPRLST